MELISRKITFEEFVNMDFPEDDPFIYELLNGQLVRKNAPSGSHQFTESKLFSLLSRYVEDNQSGMVFSSPTALILSEENVPQPDLLFLSHSKLGQFDPEWGIRGAPDLVIEITSPSSYKRDRFDKKELYEQFSIQEYWLADSAYESVEIYVLKNMKYELFALGTAGEQVNSHLFQGLSIEVKELFPS